MENNLNDKIINLYENNEFFKIYGFDFWISIIFIIITQNIAKLIKWLPVLPIDQNNATHRNHNVKNGIVTNKLHQ